MGIITTDDGSDRSVGVVPSKAVTLLAHVVVEISETLQTSRLVDSLSFISPALLTSNIGESK